MVTDQRTASTYIFGAICPAEAKAAGLVMPRWNTEAMNLHLAEISIKGPRGAMPFWWWIRPDGISRWG